MKDYADVSQQAVHTVQVKQGHAGKLAIADRGERLSMQKTQIPARHNKSRINSRPPCHSYLTIYPSYLTTLTTAVVIPLSWQNKAMRYLVPVFFYNFQQT